MRETPVSPKIDRAPSAFADHLDRMFGTRERVIKIPDDTQDHVEVSRHFESGRRYFRKRFLRSQKSGVDYRAWTNREFTLLNELKSRRLQHVQQYRSIIDLSAEEQQLETWDAGPDGDQWQQVPVARDGHRLANPFLDCGHWFSLARWLLAALDEVHALGFVHIDLKGDNFCLPAQSVGEAADGYPERVRLRWDELRLIDVAFSVWENRVPLPANMPLPIGENAEFRYQSRQLLAALGTKHSPPQPDLELTRKLDWQVDLYSLGFTLEQILREVEKRCFPEDGNWGWTEKRHAQARQLVGDLRGWDERWKQRGQPAPAGRPHGALIGLLDRVLGEDDLAASLARDWQIVRDPNWRPQDASVRTPPTVPAPKRRGERAGADSLGPTPISAPERRDEARPLDHLRQVAAHIRPERRGEVHPPVLARAPRPLSAMWLWGLALAALMGVVVFVLKEEQQRWSPVVQSEPPSVSAPVTVPQAEADKVAAQAKAEAERVKRAKAEAERVAQAKAKAEAEEQKKKAAALERERAQQQVQADQEEAKRKRLEADKTATLNRLEAAKNLLKKGNILAARLALDDARTLDREGLVEAFQKQHTANMQTAALAFLRKGQRSLAKRVVSDLGQWDPQSAEYRMLRAQMAK